jgi:ABC-type antimicrobial peptide transport system permease subunit
MTINGVKIVGKLRILKGRIRLLLQFSRINLHISAITLIGLTIALSVVSASFIYLESNQASYYLKRIQDLREENYIIYEIWNETSPYLHYNDIPLIQEFIEEELKLSGLGETFQPHSLSPFFHLDNYIRFLNQWSNSLIGLDLDETILFDCVNGSKLPVEENEVIVYSSKRTVPLEIEDDFNISKSYRDSSDNHQEYNFSLKVSGLITATSISNNSPLKEILDEEYSDKFILITDYDSFYSLIQTMNSELEALIAQDSIFAEENFCMFLKYFFYLDLTAVDQQNVIQIMDDLLKYYTALWYTTQPLEGLYFDRDGHFFTEIKAAITNFDRFYYLFLILSVPAFILAFLLVNFSLNLINERRKRSFTLLKLRGVSTSFIFLILILETFILALLSSFMSIILGFVIFIVLSSTTGFLLFDVNRLPKAMVMSPTTVTFIIIFGLSYTILAHLKSTLKLARSKVVELERVASKKRKRKPKMWRGNLDLNLLITGILGFIVFYSLMTILLNLDQRENEVWMTIIILLIGLLVFSQFATLIGGIFTFNRIIPIILHHLGNYSWKKDWRSLAVATRNLSVSRITKHVTLLITYTISFLMILSILPSTMYNNSVDHTYYGVGCDIKIYAGADGNIDMMKISNLTADLNSIQGLAATGVTRLQYNLIEKVEEHTEYTLHYNFIGIDPNFHQIAYWRDYFDDDSLEKMVFSLHNSSAKYPIIIDSFSARREELENLGTYSILSNSSELIDMTVVDISNCWPTWWTGENVRSMITKRTLIGNLSLLLGGEENYMNVDIWCKINPGYAEDDIAYQVENVTSSYGISPHDIENIFKKVQIDPESLSSVAPWIITNFNYLVALSIILIMIILFTTVRIASHTTEIGLSRALGMKPKQVFLIMFTEPLILFLISGLPGILFGSFFTLFLLQWTNPLLALGGGLPFVVYPNFFSICLIYSSIFVVTLLSGLIASIIATRANISKILKVE